jgi:hypothetical protein
MSSSGTSNNDPNGSQRPHSTSEKHPSEFLEFATVPGSGLPQTSPKHITLEPLRVEAGRESISQLNITQSNDELYRGLSDAIPNLRRLSFEAKKAAKAEHKMTFIGGCKLYPRAIGWSLLLSATIVMEGFDLVCLKPVYAGIEEIALEVC